ncbi:MAG: hypothetical protein R6X02_23985 [Enhygromyxa sp.]
MRHLSLVDPSSLPHPVRIGFEPSAGSKPEGEELELEELGEELAALGKDVNLEQAIEIGRLVIARLYDGDLAAWRRRGPKPHSLRSLARSADKSLSSSALYRSIALYELSERLGGVERWAEAGLGISHLRLVLGLGHEDQRRLLDLAATNAWTVAELEREAVATRQRSPRPGRRGGRPRLPRFVKSVNRLRKATEERDELFGDLDAAAEMASAQISEIRDVLATIRARCDELDRRLETIDEQHNSSHPAIDSSAALAD